MTSLKHLFVTTFIESVSGFMVIPSITDLTMAALCPGQDHCSLAIYLSALQQLITGLGAVVMTPIIGNLSDRYGRKTMLTLPMAVSIIPLAIMAYRRTTNFFYAFYITRTLTGMVSEGTTLSLALAYVTDKTSEDQRISAFGILSGVKSVGYVCGTLAARLLSTAAVFQVAAFMSILGLVYMRAFLKESIPDRNELTQPIIEENIGGDDENGPELLTRNQLFTKISPVADVICLIRSSTTFSQVASVSFFNSLAEKGMQASLMYFLKARFHFDKNQFADLMMIDGVAGATSQVSFTNGNSYNPYYLLQDSLWPLLFQICAILQLLLMPLLAPAIRQEKLLSIGLLASFTSVPYASRVLSIFTVIISPIVSFPCFIFFIKLVFAREKPVAFTQIYGWNRYSTLHLSKLDQVSRERPKDASQALIPLPTLYLH
ncbi:uncharacterized protein LOC111010991 isoform X1 [Momordica charantia]|uniref:Uncharacterized protein LOC111010991 isoform X1 n=1 Tax=Momordica charantia TaxID=3673 RepID=A0A6J1CEP1_MOMCH|nr:uncharacterized protein LOC111010991 isoform X1 [Momordica charantia]